MAQIMQWPPNETFVPSPLAEITEPAWKHDFEKKREFGRLLKEGLKPFEAAIKIFMNDNSAALWVSNNWVNDEIVKNVAVEPAADKNLKILDKEQLADKVLKFADERDITGKFYINEGQDRLKALELYAKICGYISNQPAVTVPIHNDNRRMEIVLVGGQKQETKPIVEAIEEEAETIDLPDVKLIN